MGTAQTQIAQPSVWTAAGVVPQCRTSWQQCKGSSFSWGKPRFSLLLSSPNSQIRCLHANLDRIGRCVSTIPAWDAFRTADWALHVLTSQLFALPRDLNSSCSACVLLQGLRFTDSETQPNSDRASDVWWQQHSNTHQHSTNKRTACIACQGSSPEQPTHNAAAVVVVAVQWWCYPPCRG
jgi:hypothetical protein